MRRTVLLYGLIGGVLVAGLKLIEYRWLLVERSVEIYGGLVAAIFAAVGIWFGLTITGRKVVVKEVPVIKVVGHPRSAETTFIPDAARIEALGITPRELEVLQLIAEGLSNKEMADRLFVSENTVKTHASRVFDKLGASRRTQAVQLAKSQGIIA